MLNGFYKLRLPDLNKQNDIQLQVNWNEKDDKINNCQVVKFVMPDGKESFIKREDLNFFLFAIGTEADQQKMIPQKLTKVKWYETTISIKAKKDIAKGENITFPIKITLPPEEKDIIGKAKTKVETKSPSGLIIPK